MTDSTSAGSLPGGGGMHLAPGAAPVPNEDAPERTRADVVAEAEEPAGSESGGGMDLASNVEAAPEPGQGATPEHPGWLYEPANYSERSEADRLAAVPATDEPTTRPDQVSPVAAAPVGAAADERRDADPDEHPHGRHARSVDESPVDRDSATVPESSGPAITEEPVRTYASSAEEPDADRAWSGDAPLPADPSPAEEAGAARASSFDAPAATSASSAEEPAARASSAEEPAATYATSADEPVRTAAADPGAVARDHSGTAGSSRYEPESVRADDAAGPGSESADQQWTDPGRGASVDDPATAPVTDPAATGWSRSESPENAGAAASVPEYNTVAGSGATDLPGRRPDHGHIGLSSQAPLRWEREDDPNDITAATFSSYAANHDQASEDERRAREINEENRL